MSKKQSEDGNSEEEDSSTKKQKHDNLDMKRHDNENAKNDVLDDLKNKSGPCQENPLKITCLFVSWRCFVGCIMV